MLLVCKRRFLIIFVPLQKGQLQLFYTVANLPIGYYRQSIVDCWMKKVCRVNFLPCVNEIRFGPDLQCPVVTIAAHSNYVETITPIGLLGVLFRSMFNKHCTGFTILCTQTETTMPL